MYPHHLRPVPMCVSSVYRPRTVLYRTALTLSYTLLYRCRTNVLHRMVLLYWPCTTPYCTGPVLYRTALTKYYAALYLPCTTPYCTGPVLHRTVLALYYTVLVLTWSFLLHFQRMMNMVEIVAKNPLTQLHFDHEGEGDAGE